MKIFAMDDFKRTIDSEDYKKSCMNYQFNMLENRLTRIGKIIQHITWTKEKVEEWQKERPQERLSEQYNIWLENRFEMYKRILKIK